MADPAPMVVPIVMMDPIPMVVPIVMMDPIPMHGGPGPIPQSGTNTHITIPMVDRAIAFGAGQ